MGRKIDSAAIDFSGPARRLEELGKRHLKRCRQTVQQVNGGVLRLPFQAADIRTVNFGITGQTLLREAALDFSVPASPGYQYSSIHGLKRARQRLLNHVL
jgi:hypothetical protein